MLGPDKNGLQLIFTCDAEESVINVLYASVTANPCTGKQHSVILVIVRETELRKSAVQFVPWHRSLQ